ncbi:type II secretory pathway, component PulD [Aureispira anguillae]|uniref:Type II secretory pathway, component PulD n=1 Tax=Aureispira anguillae TaxID=2864201 RepID=A0A916DW58_9BACT|nr:type II secretory pathway, component PulD [Aureispira anguillae]BDS14305.1 type II secretory pathway, component PulD [Aureispira anguillae]
MKIRYWGIIFFLLMAELCQAQFSRIDKLTESLESFSVEHKNLNRKIDISALGSVQEIVTSIAQQTKINITIDPSIQQNVVSNFTKIKIKELLIYFCQQYDLDLKFIGSIISVVPYQAPVLAPTLKEIGVYYNKYNTTLSLDLKNDTLANVTRKITQQSGTNIIVSPKAQQQKVNGFVDKTPVDEALKLLAKSNDLYLTETPEGAFFLRTNAEVPKEEIEEKVQKKKMEIGAGVNYEAIENLELTTTFDSINNEYRMDITALNVPFGQILKGASIKMGKDYFLFGGQKGGLRAATNPSQVNRNNRNRGNNATTGAGGISLKLEDITYEEFLNYILKGTNLTYKIDNEIYLIGDRDMEGLRQTKTIQLQYRSAKEIEKVIPKKISEKVDIFPFLELNSVILSGSAPDIQEVEEFLRGIDKLVPVVMIELIIMDVQRNRLTETGLQMGIGDKPVEQERIGLSPGFDFQLGATSVNKLLSMLGGGQGIVNLGAVLPNFYLSLKAIEEVGLVKTHSRPQLATLNSHEANFNIGETRYYLESRTTVQGVQGTVTQQDVNYKSVQADFTINVTPYVSGDEQITLEIDMQQSAFLGELQLNAPPAQTTRKFDSQIRVKNGDMIALGGLESKNKSKTGRGLPLMARVPILNLFGNRRNSNKNSELIIFIKPTIVY